METANSTDGAFVIPGTTLSNRITVTQIGQIVLEDQITDNLVLSPIAVATYHESPSKISLSVVIFLPIVLDSVPVHYLSCLNASGYPELQFYIPITYPNPTSNRDPFFCYQLNFEVDITLVPNINEVVTIETFLLNEDPKTSRGTVTTVAHST